MNLEFFLFNRYLVSNRNYSLVTFVNFLSFVSIFISIIILLLIISISNGFRLKLENTVLKFDPHLIILCNEIGANIKCIEQNKIFCNNNIEKANFTFYSQIFLRSDKGFFDAIIKGIDFSNTILSNFKMHRNKKKNLKKGIYDNIPTIILGDLLSKKIGIIVGEIIYIIPSILDKQTPIFLPFRVIGLLHSGIQYYDESLVCVDLENCYNLFMSKHIPKYIEIRLKNISTIDGMSKKIKNAIGHRFLVKSLMQINADFFLTLKIQKVVIILILLIINIISTSIISSSFAIMFLEKISEIAILKIIGLNNLKIKIIFTMKAMFIVLVACSFGYFFGIFSCCFLKYSNIVVFFNIKIFFSKLPIQINSFEIFFILFITIVFSLFFTFLSSLRISFLQLKKEIYRK